MTDNTAIKSDDAQLDALVKRLTERERLLSELECETHRTIELLRVLSTAALSYFESCEDLGAQAAFYGLNTALSDRREVLEALTERF